MVDCDLVSSGLERLVSADSTLEKLADGCTFTEGPVWNAVDGYLLWSDIPENRIRQWSPDARVTFFRDPSGKSNGLTYDRQGRLIASEHGNRRVSRTEPDGSIVTLASHYEGKRLNSPNDVVVKSDGSIYFTDPPYGLMEGLGGDDLQQYLDFYGVYRLSPDGSTLTLLVDDFSRPNGLAFSPDESLLYIDDTERGHIRVFHVATDGTLEKGTVFAELKGDGAGAPDGMKVDVEGNIYCTGPGGIFVLDPAGKLLGRIRMPEQTTNVAWGDSDWKSLFITASSSVYRLHLNVPGIPLR